MKQNGQSLIEFIILTPIFFIILSGLISIFYLQNRHYVDVESSISISMSQFLFEDEERITAQWDESNKKNITSLKSSLNKALNPSLAFNLATDKNNNVFLDKSLIKYSENTNCSSKNTYSFSFEKSNQFQINTCSDKNGYEKHGFSFQNVLDKFSLSSFQIKGDSLYYPFSELSWKNRSTLATTSAQKFITSAQGVSFSKNYASLFYPADNSLFNGKCFMEPFTPQCSLHPYSGKMDRAARDGTNTQLFACYTEMAIDCAKTGELIPMCIAEGVIEIKLSTEIGRAARNCPIINKETERYFMFIKGIALSASMANSLQELEMRKNFF